MYGLELLLGDTMNADEFKKQFPNISYIVDKPFNENFEQINIRLFTMNDIAEHCIDKQRVREAINNIGGNDDLMEAREQLLKELGLGVD